MVIGAERHAGRSVSGGCYLLTAIQSLIRVPRFRPPKEREAALCKSLAPPAEFQKLPCTATAVQKARKVFAPNPAVAVQGSSGRVREVWRVGRTLRKGPSCSSKVFPLQGLPFLPPTSTSTSMSSSDSIAPWFCGGGKPQRRSKASCRPQRI